VTATREGSRCLLVDPSARGRGSPRRAAIGVDAGRLALLAVLEGRASTRRVRSSSPAPADSRRPSRRTWPSSPPWFLGAELADPGRCCCFEIGLPARSGACLPPGLRLKEAAAMGYDRFSRPAMRVKPRVFST
jgi:hypothetical protein